VGGQKREKKWCGEKAKDSGKKARKRDHPSCIIGREARTSFQERKLKKVGLGDEEKKGLGEKGGKRGGQKRWHGTQAHPINSGEERGALGGGK